MKSKTNKTKSTTSKNKGNYNIVLKFNDKIFKINTDDLSSAILKEKPLILKTRLIIDVEKNGKSFSKIFFVPQGRMLFKNKTWLEIFINQIKRILG